MKCSKCGCKDYYKFQRYSGIGAIVYKRNGEVDMSSIHDGTLYKKEQKTAYCNNCQKKLTKEEMGNE